MSGDEKRAYKIEKFKREKVAKKRIQVRIYPWTYI
jgi:hypothetical protein